MEENANILDVAHLVVLAASQKGIGVTPLKLQKLLYYLQAWNLVFFNTPVFQDEPEAWVNGPVYRKVYDHYRDYQMYEFIKIAPEEKLHIDERVAEIVRAIGFEASQQELFDEIISKYGKMASADLGLRTHSEDPWKDARKGLGIFDYSNNVITHASMAKYYCSLLNKKNQ